MIYLIFNEGYAATAGDDWMRPALCGEAQRLVRVLARLAPDGPVLLMDQDRARWAPCRCAGA